MINLQFNTRYKLIGIAEQDRGATLEGSIIEIVNILNPYGTKTYTYKIVSGKVCNSHGGGGDFSIGSRLHAYCIPTYPYSRLPDLKRGDYVISVYPGSKAWMVTDDSLMLEGSFGTSNMRYATWEEQKEAENPLLNNNQGMQYTVGDILVVKEHTSGLDIDTIIRVDKVEGNYIRSHDFRSYNTSIVKTIFRAATKLEEKAYLQGYRLLRNYTKMIENVCRNKFPSPVSYISQGIRYIDVLYFSGDFVWDERGMRPRPGLGYIFLDGEWAEPIEDPNHLAYHVPQPAGAKSFNTNFRESLDYVRKTLEEAAFPYDRVLGKLPIKNFGFSEEEYKRNPLNQKMELPKKNKKPVTKLKF